VQADDTILIGTYYFTLAARLTNYPAKGYFPKITSFSVSVSSTTKELTPSSYTYTIGSRMLPIVYEISKNSGTASISVNGINENIEEIYGVIFN
jgi:hypothetical protein